MEKGKIIFFRNDDVGLFSNERVSSELINLTQVFIQENIPIHHGVVPAAVNKETIAWLLATKANYPHLISIDQHGYAHVKYSAGEFGGTRSYSEQKRDIVNGLELMNRYFGPSFSHCFTAPWVKYNRHTKRICDELGFQVFSGGVSPKFHARIFNFVGRLLNLTVLGSKEVSYHRKGKFGQKGFKIPEISVAIDIAENYQERRLKPQNIVQGRYKQSEKCFDVIGFLLHQWIFDEKKKLEYIRDLILSLKNDKSISFKLMGDIVGGSGNSALTTQDMTRVPG